MAVTVVTRLLKPVKVSLGIKFSMYVDDGWTLAATFDFVLLVLQLAGWRIQWKKTVTIIWALSPTLSGFAT